MSHYVTNRHNIQYTLICIKMANYMWQKKTSFYVSCTLHGLQNRMFFNHIMKAQYAYADACKNQAI